MLGAFRILLLFAVLWCGLHFDEAAEAKADWAYAAAESDTSGSSSDRGEEPENIAHASHHHCPIAPDPRVLANEEAVADLAALHFAKSTAALHSLAQAPPLEPPTA